MPAGIQRALANKIRIIAVATGVQQIHLGIQCALRDPFRPTGHPHRHQVKHALRTDKRRRGTDRRLLHDLLNREAPVVEAAILVQGEHLLRTDQRNAHEHGSIHHKKAPTASRTRFAGLSWRRTRK